MRRAGPPGVHAILARRYGAKSTALPILVDRGTLIQGSGAIIDWADRNASDVTRKLTVTRACEIEQRTDAVIGVQVRRLSYAEMLSPATRLDKSGLFHNASRRHRWAASLMWPVTRRLMIRAMDLGPGATAESRQLLEVELDWLDGILADGRAYLVGDSLSRADISVASLLAPIAQPEGMPAFHQMILPDTLRAIFAGWRDRAVVRWAAALYRTRRVPAAWSSGAAA
jgi:glutathione S-transferase